MTWCLYGGPTKEMFQLEFSSFSPCVSMPVYLHTIGRKRGIGSSVAAPDRVILELRIPVKPAAHSGEIGHPIGAKRRWSLNDQRGGRFGSRYDGRFTLCTLCHSLVVGPFFDPGDVFDLCFWVCNGRRA